MKWKPIFDVWHKKTENYKYIHMVLRVPNHILFNFARNLNPFLCAQQMHRRLAGIFIIGWPKGSSFSHWGLIEGPAGNPRYDNAVMFDPGHLISPHDAERRQSPGRMYTQRNIFGILLNQTEIRLYLLFSDWFGTANRHCPFAVPNQSKNGKYNLISVWFKKISERFICVCGHLGFIQQSSVQ